MHCMSKVVYHKFSHNTTSYTVNVENVNMMLELQMKITWWFHVCFNSISVVSEQWECDYVCALKCHLGLDRIFL